MDRAKIANKVSFVTIIINLLLSVFKFIAGVLGKSGAMVSDAIHSASDVASTVMVIAGVNISVKDSDRGHQYGHEKLECIFSILLAVLLFLTGAGIGWSGIQKIISGGDKLAVPGTLALIAAVISVLVKEAMFWYTRAAAKKINSTSLMADAWHHRTDAMSSVGSFIGILGARMGFPICDPIASILICILIVKAAWDIFREATGELVDEACDSKTVNSIAELIKQQEGVISLDDLKTRRFGSKIYVDVEIGADGNLTLYAAHDIAQRVHDAIENSNADVKHCMVHVNPKEILDKAV